MPALRVVSYMGALMPGHTMPIAYELQEWTSVLKAVDFRVSGSTLVDVFGVARPAVCAWPTLRAVCILGSLAACSPFNCDVLGSTGPSTNTLKDIASIKSGTNNVAILREVDCPGDFAQGESYFAVFVHRLGEPNSSKNLVFQYMPDDLSKDPALKPRLQWIGGSQLWIKAEGAIEKVVRQRTHIGNIRIMYSLGLVESRDQDAEDTK